MLQDAIDDGWIYSTWGPKGGYWRTDKKAKAGLDEALDALIDGLRAATNAAQTVRDILATTP